MLRPKLEEQLARHQFGLIILDPAYKVLGDRDENANGEIAGLMNEFEALAQKTRARPWWWPTTSPRATARPRTPWTG